MLSHKYNFHTNIYLTTYYVHNMFILICYHTYYMHTYLYTYLDTYLPTTTQKTVIAAQ